MGYPEGAVKTTSPEPDASRMRVVLPGGHPSRRPLRRRGLLRVSGYFFGLENSSAHAEEAPSFQAPSRSVRSWRFATVTAVVACWTALALITPALAQNPNQFGAQDRADAAAELIVIAVERAIASLPPTSGPSVTYEFDPASDAFRRSIRLGPTVLRSSQTIGPGNFSLQFATSYFEMAQSFRPINYLFTLDEPQARQVVSKLGLDASARVTLMNMSATYGLGTRVELSASLPITVVDAHAAQDFSTRTDALSLPAAEAPLTGILVLDGDVQEATQYLNSEIQAGRITLRQETFKDLGFDFDEGTNVGIGRISLGGKGIILSTEAFQAAAMADLFLPSPSEGAFAGSASVAVLPRLVGSLKLTDALKLHSDLGYEYDFETPELRQFTWRVGGSLAFERVAFDVGLGGSEYDTAVEWTPSVIHGGQTATLPASTGVALDDNTAGTSVVDVLLGAKLRVTDAFVIAGGVSIPVVSPAFQPDVLGTVAVEWCF
jgi:hypothetical protein